MLVALGARASGTMFVSIIWSGDDCADGNFALLSKHLNLLDLEISKIDSAIKLSKDPESDGLCDVGEYFIGHGFIAAQHYITSTYPQMGLTKSAALSLGPRIRDDLTLVEALNAGANYWKHLEEWGLKDPWIIIERNKSALEGQALKTIQTIEKITPWAEYTCSNLLAEIASVGGIELSPLLPLIAEWRDNGFRCSS